MKMKRILNKIVRKEEGQGMVEYVLIVAGIAAVIIAALAIFGPKLAALIGGINLAG
jgi:pilus assembly protein Flp/PilA